MSNQPQRSLLAAVALAGGLLWTGCAPAIVQMNVDGALETTDARLARDGSAFDDYRFACRRGDTITVGLSSEDFDPYVFVVTPDGAVIHDDDGGAGWNAALTVVIPVTGECAIVANTYVAGEFGDYTLVVDGVR